MKDKLKLLADQIRDWQTSRDLSDNKLLDKFKGLGSTKTYKRILDSEWEGLDLERWFEDYRQVWTLIELEGGEEEDEPVYDDLWHVRAARLAVNDALQERGNNRLVIIEGPSGSGKTTAGKCLADRYGRRIVMCEADETWKGPNLNAMLAGLLRKLGIREVPVSGDERKTRLLEVLGQSPVCLIIDEAHHLGPRTLNMVKTILNQTKCQVVFLCIETLFKKLEMTAYEEAKQLTKNRLCERVRLNGPVVADVETFLRRRIKWDDEKPVKNCAEALAKMARSYGGWNFVGLTCRKCKHLAGRQGMDSETFAKAMLQAERSR